jgi:hypothetical protein
MFVNNALVLGGNCRADSLLDVIGSLFQSLPGNVVARWHVPLMLSRQQCKCMWMKKLPLEGSIPR